jgi:hypothetical protein
MTEPDNAGKEWSYLASESNYGVVRNLETRNLIIPITGDFGGPKAIRAVGSYLADHGAVVSAFYTSNVEGYCSRAATEWAMRMAALRGSMKMWPSCRSTTAAHSFDGFRAAPWCSSPSTQQSTTSGPAGYRRWIFSRGVELAGSGIFHRRAGGLTILHSSSTGPYMQGSCFHLLAALAAFAIRFVAGALWSRLASRDRILSCFAWAVCGYALAGIVESSLSGAGWLRLPLYLNKSLLIVYGLPYTAGFAADFRHRDSVRFQKIAGFRLSGSDDAGAALPLILLPVFGIHVAGDINRALDIRQPMIMRMSVLRRSADSMRYYIDIEGAATAGFLPSKIEVSRRFMTR